MFPLWTSANMLCVDSLKGLSFISTHRPDRVQLHDVKGKSSNTPANAGTEKPSHAMEKSRVFPRTGTFYLLLNPENLMTLKQH